MLYRSMPLPPVEGYDFKHWHFSIDQWGFAWAGADRADEAVNTLGFDVMAEMGDIVDAVTSKKAAGLCFYSAKDSGFFHGADIREFEQFTEENITEMLEQGHQLFDRIAQLDIPTVAAISGACAGGGYELALACQYRIAHNIDSTRIGLPEVKLGIHPGLGGTARLTTLIGGKDAMPLMLTGRLLRASAAKRLGMVDQLVSANKDILWAARKAMQQKRKSKGAGLVARMSNSALARPMLANIMEKQTAKKARKDHYPAPFALIDLWRKHGGDETAMLAAEKESFAPLMVSDTAKNLRRVFFLMERLKGIGKDKQGKPIRRLHVIGAGTMGADIAAWSASRGLEVTLQDINEDALAEALGRAKKLFRRRIKNRVEAKTAEGRLKADPEGNGIARADLIIEAIVENPEIKRKVYAEVEAKMSKDAILATNTSSLPLEELSKSLKNPSRFIGLHFFNPVAQMPLVEVVYYLGSAPDVVKRGAAFANAIGKLPLPTKSAPGFLVNRVLAPYMLEAFERLEAGANKEDLDAAATAFGMPMGPVELVDVVGLDIAREVTKTLNGEDAIPAKLQEMVDAGHLGKKTDQGFYAWEKGKPKREDVTLEKDALLQLGEELVAPLVAETQKALDEGIVDDADLADAGVIFGTGFAPFHGGPLNYHSNKTA